VETRALHGRKRRAKTDREHARWLRELLDDGRLPEASDRARAMCVSRARPRGCATPRSTNAPPGSGEAVGKFGEDCFMRRAPSIRGRPRSGVRRAAASLDGDGGDLVAVQLQEIVGGGDEPPFRAAGRSAAALEAADLTVALELPENGLDRGLALAGERAAAGGSEHVSHEVIKPAGPSGARAAAQARVRRNEHLDAVGDDRLDLALMPIAGVGHHDVWVGEVDAAKLALRGADHRLEMPKSGQSQVSSAAITTCCSLTASWAL
jgi:hypothetical protein